LDNYVTALYQLYDMCRRGSLESPLSPPPPPPPQVVPHHQLDSDRDDMTTSDHRTSPLDLSVSSTKMTSRSTMTMMMDYLEILSFGRGMEPYCVPNLAQERLSTRRQVIRTIVQLDRTFRNPQLNMNHHDNNNNHHNIHVPLYHGHDHSQQQQQQQYFSPDTVLAILARSWTEPS
jgi:hypothetical protein